MSSLRVLAALVAMPLALTASVVPSSAATDRPDGSPAVSLVEQRVIEIPGSDLVALSPDGGSIAVTSFSYGVVAGSMTVRTKSLATSEASMP